MNQQAHTKLVLFDIDGTLMITQGASSRCMKRAGRIVLGPTFEWHPITVGTLDPQIFDQLAQANGVSPTPEQRAQYESVYLEELEHELNTRIDDITVLPGISSVIDALHRRAVERRDVVLGVLTGNFRKATELKLELSGLGLERFPVIACAEHGKTRNELPAAAMRLAHDHTSRPITGKDTIIVGDTPRDIECAKANHCACVSVATGHYSVEQLSEAGGTVVVESLADPSLLLAMIDAE